MSRTIQDVLEEVQHLECCVAAAERILEYVDKTAQKEDEEKREVFASIADCLLVYVDEKTARLETLMQAPFGGKDSKDEKKVRKKADGSSKHKDDKKRKVREKSHKKHKQSG